MGLVITIAGLHGTGKTTYAKMIANEFDLQVFSIGLLFRKMAKEKNLSLKEFSSYVEKNPEIDKKLDDQIIMEAKKGDDVIIDSQLSAWMTRELSNIKIFLTSPIKVRVKRIALRDNVSYEKAERETITREKSERKRYKDLYNIDLSDLSIYDIIINTAIWSIEPCFQILKTAIKEYQKHT